MKTSVMRALALVTALSLGGCFIFWSSKKHEKEEIQQVPNLNAVPDKAENSKGKSTPDELIFSSKSGVPFTPSDVQSKGPTTSESFNPIHSSKSGILITPSDVEPKAPLLSGSKSLSPHFLHSEKSKVTPPQPSPTPTPAPTKR